MGAAFQGCLNISPAGRAFLRGDGARSRHSIDSGACLILDFFAAGLPEGCDSPDRQGETEKCVYIKGRFEVPGLEDADYPEDKEDDATG